MIDIKFSMFFDKTDVLKRVRDGTRSALSKLGAFVRTRAKSSIRKRKRSAEPGQPPSSHTGRLKDLIFFAYDAARESVVIGPLLFRSRQPTVPQVLEEGGAVTSQWRTGKPATYRQFPFMVPALQAEQQRAPELFTNCVK